MIRNSLALPTSARARSEAWSAREQFLQRWRHEKKKNALFSVLIRLENHLSVQGFPSQALKDGKFGVALHWNFVYFNCVANLSHKFGVKYVRSSWGGTEWWPIARVLSLCSAKLNELA